MREPEARTFTLTRFDSNLPAHSFDQTLTDGQSQSGTLHERVQFYKTIKNLMLLFFGNPFACIQSPNQKIPNRKTKCVIETHLNIKQNVILGANLKPV